MIQTPKASTRKRDRDRVSLKSFLPLIPMVAVAVGFIAIWEVLFRLEIWPEFLVPSPRRVGDYLVRLWTGTTGPPFVQGPLPRGIAATLLRLAVGFAISLVLGALLSFLMVHFVTFGKGIQPYILGLQTFPSIAWVPLAIIWFGLSESTLLFVTIVGSLFAVTNSFVDALRTVPPAYLKAARNMGSDGMDLILRVTVPAALPHLITAAKVGWSFAWRSLIGAEVIFATVGLGFLVHRGGDALNMPEVMGVMIVILVLGILIDQGVFARTQERVARRRGLLVSR